MKANVLIWGLFTKSQWTFGRIQEYQLRGSQEFVRYHSEMGLVTCSRGSECIHDWVDILTLNEILTVARSSDQVDESKSNTSTQIPSYVLWRCKTMQEQTKNGQINSDNFNSPILTENCLEPLENPFEFEWNICPTSLEIFPKNPEESARSKDRSRTCGSFEFRTSQELCKKGSRVNTGLFSAH